MPEPGCVHGTQVGHEVGVRHVASGPQQELAGVRLVGTDLRPHLSLCDQNFLEFSSRIVAEYGMTELGSQAYEGCLSMGSREGVFLAPPWMRVRAVHPETLEEVPNGDEGLARIEDLTNADSAVAVQTADRIRLTDDGFMLLGRTASATPRGCSIGIDEILDRGGSG